MSDKNLLNENTIRRFMKLANVDTMTDNFISEMGKAYKKNEKELEEEAKPEEEVVEEADHGEGEDKPKVKEGTEDEDVVEEEFELTTEE